MLFFVFDKYNLIWFKFHFKSTKKIENKKCGLFQDNKTNVNVTEIHASWAEWSQLKQQAKPPCLKQGRPFCWHCLEKRTFHCCICPSSSTCFQCMSRRRSGCHTCHRHSHEWSALQFWLPSTLLPRCSFPHKFDVSWSRTRRLPCICSTWSLPMKLKF